MATLSLQHIMIRKTSKIIHSNINDKLSSTQKISDSCVKELQMMMITDFSLGFGLILTLSYLAFGSNG